MLISVHTTITNPTRWNYPYLECIDSFLELADEVVVVDGGSDDGSLETIKERYEPELRSRKLKLISLPWGWDYSQAEFPRHLNAGLIACTGDWCIKVDADYVAHEAGIKATREYLMRLLELNVPFAEYHKYTVVNRQFGFSAQNLPFALNMSMLRGKVAYGRTLGMKPEQDDWSFPIIIEQFIEDGVPIGARLTERGVAVAKIPLIVWNYDAFFRTEDDQKKIFARQAKAYRDTVAPSWGKDDDDAWKYFLGQTARRLARPHETIAINQHPKYIRERVRNMPPEQFGYDNWETAYHDKMRLV